MNSSLPLFLLLAFTANAAVVTATVAGDAGQALTDGSITAPASTGSQSVSEWQVGPELPTASAPQTESEPPHLPIETVLLEAATRGEAQVVRDLLAQGASADTRARDRNQRTALILSAAGGHLETVVVLLAAGAAFDMTDAAGLTALNWATMRGRDRVVRHLLDQGADPDIADGDGVTPLLYAVGTHNRDLQSLLIRAGANLEAESRVNQMTPLLLAVETEDTEAVRLLLEQGADANGHNHKGLSPLMTAAEKGNIEIARALLAYRADIAYVDPQGQTAQLLAEQQGELEMLRLLEEKR